LQGSASTSQRTLENRLPTQIGQSLASHGRPAASLAIQPFSEERLRELIPSPQPSSKKSQTPLSPIHGRPQPSLGGWSNSRGSHERLAAAAASRVTFVQPSLTLSNDLLSSASTGLLPTMTRSARQLPPTKPLSKLLRPVDSVPVQGTPSAIGNAGMPRGTSMGGNRASSATALTQSAAAVRMAELSALQINTASGATSTPPIRPPRSRLGLTTATLQHECVELDDEGDQRSPMPLPRKVSFSAHAQLPPPCPSPESPEHAPE